MSKGLEAKNRLLNKCSEYLTLSIDHQVAQDFLTIEKELKTLDVFSNFEMELDASKTIDGRIAYSLTIKNERDEELTLFLGGWEKDYNLLKEWLKRL